MLKLCGNNMLSHTAFCKCRADQCHIIRLRTPGSKNDLLWLCPKIPYERATGVQDTKAVINKLVSDGVRSVGIFIGPEGGFEEDEVQLALAAGAHFAIIACADFTYFSASIPFLCREEGFPKSSPITRSITSRTESATLVVAALSK